MRSDNAQGTSRYGHALVIGGSLAGMLAARVLSDHFDEVTVVERDPWPEAADPRKGVPQGRHAHGLLCRGRQVLGELFPGLEAELHDAGATWIDMGADFRWHHFGRYRARHVSGVRAPFMSRPLLEWHVSRRVAALVNVRVMAACEVTELVLRADRTATAGVKLRHREGTESEELVHADLVVDASGRGSRLPRWLDALGYPKPEESHVRVHVGYATRIYPRLSPPPDWKVLFIVPRAPAKRGGMIVPIEGNRWFVTLIGWLHDHPPLDEKGYLDFARSLPVPELYRTIDGIEPQGPIVGHGFPSNRRYHYERAARFPEGLIAVGDAACSFNPIYGQGMTVSILEAAVLDECLRAQRRTRGGSLRGLTHRTRQEIAKIVDVAWGAATGEDFRYPEVQGRRPPTMAFLHWYMRHVHDAASRDPQVARRVLQVIHLLEPPSTLFDPAMLLRVARASL